MILEKYFVQKISWWSDTPTLIILFWETLEGTVVKIWSIKVDMLQITQVGDCINCFKLYIFTAWKVSKYGVFSDPYFLAFGLNTESYFVSLSIQSKCGKIQTRKNSVFGHFSRSAYNHQLSCVIITNSISVFHVYIEIVKKTYLFFAYIIFFKVNV